MWIDIHLPIHTLTFTPWLRSIAAISIYFFLGACTQFYNPLCPLVGRLVGPSVMLSFRAVASAHGPRHNEAHGPHPFEIIITLPPSFTFWDSTQLWTSTNRPPPRKTNLYIPEMGFLQLCWYSSDFVQRLKHYFKTAKFYNFSRTAHSLRSAPFRYACSLLSWACSITLLNPSSDHCIWYICIHAVNAFNKNNRVCWRQYKEVLLIC